MASIGRWKVAQLLNIKLLNILNALRAFMLGWEVLLVAYSKILHMAKFRRSRCLFDQKLTKLPLQNFCIFLVVWLVTLSLIYIYSCPLVSWPLCMRSMVHQNLPFSMFVGKWEPLFFPSWSVAMTLSTLSWVKCLVLKVPLTLNIDSESKRQFW